MVAASAVVWVAAVAQGWSPSEQDVHCAPPLHTIKHWTARTIYGRKHGYSCFAARAIPLWGRALL